MSPVIAYFPDEWMLIDTLINTKHKDLYATISVAAVRTHHRHVQQPDIKKATSAPKTNNIVLSTVIDK